MQPHRKRIKRHHELGDFHELTFSCYERSQLLLRDDWRRLLCQAIDRAISDHEFALVAFVLMPEHVHLLVYPRRQTAQALAGPRLHEPAPTADPRQWHPVSSDVDSSHSVPDRISRLLADIKRPFSGRVKKRLVEELNPLLSQLTVTERPGKKAFRFWQEGPDYDRNLSSEQAVLAAIDYIHLNPVRRGLVARASDWKWSSARWYASDGKEQDPDLPTIHGPPWELFV
jgi:putative transposase